MAEIKSVQMAKLAAVPAQKLATTESHGRVRIMFAALATTHAEGAIADTVVFGRIPAGARILPTGTLACAAGTASSTLDIGLRRVKDRTVIDADGLAAAVNIASAGSKAINTGALIANGASYVTVEEVEVYGTIAGAVLAANQAMNVQITYVTD